MELDESLADFLAQGGKIKRVDLCDFKSTITANLFIGFLNQRSFYFFSFFCFHNQFQNKSSNTPRKL